MDSNTSDRLSIIEAKLDLQEAQMAVVRKDLSSLRQQLVRLIVMYNELDYELNKTPRNVQVQKEDSSKT